MTDNAAVVVPWVSEKQVELFLDAWNLDGTKPDWLVLQHDSQREGCAATKNKAIVEAVKRGYDVVVSLDDDCYPHGEVRTLPELMAAHVEALKPKRVELFEVVTEPASRGTPYGVRSLEMPVAASMGFWTGVGDYCGVRQLATGAPPMDFRRKTVFANYFPLCGMNLAFRPREWLPWCRFIDAPRYDDIWMGWLWQREAYRRRYCFNLAGPLVRHVRQSNPWRNLAVEAVHLEASETLWARIAAHESDNYESLFALLPQSVGGSDR
ncbi:MAG: hypothetical protein WC683_18710 [bacterium]